MTPLRPATEKPDVLGCDRCDALTRPALPSGCPSRCMSPGSVCATRPRSGARALQYYSSLLRPGHPETPTAPRLLASNAGQMSPLYPCVLRVGSEAGGSVHTRPATVQP